MFGNEVPAIADAVATCTPIGQIAETLKNAQRVNCPSGLRDSIIQLQRAKTNVRKLSALHIFPDARVLKLITLLLLCQEARFTLSLLEGTKPSGATDPS